MSQSTVHLIHMANEIANNLAAGKSADEAAAATAHHLQLFWSPAMREQLRTAQNSSENGENKLNAIALAASQMLTLKRN